MPKRDKELAMSHRGKPCIVCGSTLGSCGDHILTFGSRPELDKPFNMWTLCFKCHHIKGNIGLGPFVRKHKLENELLERGFYRCPFDGKWRYSDE